jgi:hypothetical protein
MIRKLFSIILDKIKADTVFDVFDDIPEMQLDDIIKSIEESEPPTH